MENIAEIGIGGLFAATVIKTVLPYLKPAKNGHVGREIVNGLKPLMDRQQSLLDRMNERDIVTASKVLSTHDNIKDVANVCRDTCISVDAVHKRMDKMNL